MRGVCLYYAHECFIRKMDPVQNTGLRAEGVATFVGVHNSPAAAVLLYA